MSIGIGLGIPKKYGKANEYYLEFDGVDDNILIGDKLDFNYDAERSIAFKFKTSATTAVMAIMSKSDGSGATYPYRGWHLSIYLGKIYFRYYEDGTSTGVKANTTATFNDGNWHNVVVLYDGDKDNPDIIIYVDDMANPCDLDKTVYGFSGVDTTNDADLYIGQASYGSAFFNGSLDQMSISSGLLTENQRNNIFTKVSGLAYWDFNEGKGIIAHDKTGNGNDGTLYGGATLPIWREW